MFWNKKEEYSTTAFGILGHFENYVLGRMLEKASALQDQNRRDYNVLFERQNLILDHLKLKYVPETETKEPAKLIDWGTMKGDKGSNYTWTGSGWIITPPAKKQGRPKKK